jgi:hypothetical protein
MAGAGARRRAGVETLIPGAPAARATASANDNPMNGSSMPYTETLFQTIVDSVAAPGSIAQRMHTLIDACARRLPHPDWERIRRIDFEADAAALQGWLAVAWREGVLHQGHQGLWFGIVNPVVDNEPVTDLVVASSPAYADEGVGWSDAIDPRDGASYLDSAVLADIYRVAYGLPGGLGNDADYPLALAYAAMAGSSALAQHLPAPQLGSLRAAAAGFDSGDGLIIGVFDNLRFIRRVRAAC